MEQKTKGMKRYMLMVAWIAAFAVGFTSCSDDDDKIPVVKPTATGTMTDNDGNEYHWVRIGNLDWMTENLHDGIPFFDDAYSERWGTQYFTWKGTREEAQEHYERFGNYYSWQEAVDNAPEGWRLPTDDDWKNLETTLGMSKADVDKDGWRPGASTLMTQGTEGTGLNFLYGGQICYFSWNMSVYHDYDYGYYWTATEANVNGESASYARSITPSRNAVNRIIVLHQEHCLSVRYVRDAQ